MNKEKLERIKGKMHKARNKQIGNIRFDEDTFNKISEISKDFCVTKQWFIQQIVIDFLIEK